MRSYMTCTVLPLRHSTPVLSTFTTIVASDNEQAASRRMATSADTKDQLAKTWPILKATQLTLNAYVHKIVVPITVYTVQGPHSLKVC